MSSGTAIRRMNMWNMIAYGCIDIYGGGAFFLIGSLYLVFLTVVVGLAPLYAGSIIFLGKIWAACANAGAGYISDHTRSRFGRRRVYFLLGVVPIFSVLWVPVSFASEALTFAYHLATYLLYNTVFAFTKVPYNGILAAMTRDHVTRSKAMGVRMVFSQGGMLLSAFVPLTIISHAASQRAGYLAFGIIFGLLFALPWLIGFSGTWEQDGPIANSPLSWSDFRQIFPAFWSTTKNRTFVIHMVVYLLTFLNMDVFNGVILFFATSTLGLTVDEARNLVTIIQGSQMVAIPLVTWSVCRLGNAVALRWSLLVWGTGIVSLALSPTGTGVLRLLPQAVLTGLGLSGAMMIPWNIQTFVADVDELITKQRRDGLYAGVMQFVRQFAIGLGLFGTNLAMEIFGFVKGSSMQSQAFGEALRYLLMIAPVVILGGAIQALRHFKLDATSHSLLIDEIARLKSGGKRSHVEPAVRAVVERLTGLNYKSLWRDEFVRKPLTKAASCATLTQRC